MVRWWDVGSVSSGLVRLVLDFILEGLVLNRRLGVLRQGVVDFSLSVAVNVFTAASVPCGAPKHTTCVF